MKLTDNFGRVHDYLRISLTDRCNLNCTYCNPLHQEAEYIDSEEILSFEEVKRLIKIFAEYFSFNKIRFTGGEPLARRSFVPFIHGLKDLKRQYGFTTAITTNGILLADRITDLSEGGIDHFNISLDSLDPNTFKKITGKYGLHKVLAAIFRAREISCNRVKINCVVMRGINDQEITQFTDFALTYDLNVRYIEYMPFTNNGWNKGVFMSSAQIKSIIETKYELEPSPDNGSVSKDYFIKGNNGQVSFISSISDHFCDSCSRLRITARGGLRLCLFSEENHEFDLRALMRGSSLNDNEMAEEIAGFVKTKLEKHPEVNELVKLNYNYMLRNGG